MLAYYPPTVNFRSLEKLAPGLGRLQDVREIQRQKDVERKKMLGKGPPKKGECASVPSFSVDRDTDRNEVVSKRSRDDADPLFDLSYSVMNRRGPTCGYEGKEKVIVALSTADELAYLFNRITDWTLTISWFAIDLSHTIICTFRILTRTLHLHP